VLLTDILYLYVITLPDGKLKRKKIPDASYEARQSLFQLAHCLSDVSRGFIQPPM